MLSTLPYAWYSDPEQLRREQEAIFRSTWQYAGHAGQVADPGSFFTTTAGLTSRSWSRVTRDGVLRAFLNVCRHRGSLGRAGRGAARGAPVPVPRVDVRPRRLAPRGAARRPRARLRQAEELGLLPASVGTWGPVRLRQPRRRRAAARGGPRPMPELVAEPGSTSTGSSSSALEPRSRRTGRSSARTSSSATTARSRTRACRRSIDVSFDAYRLETERARLDPARAGPRRADRASTTPRASRARPVPLPLAEHGDEHPPGPAEPLDRADRPRLARAGRRASSTTSSRPARTRRGSQQLLEFDDQVGREDKVLVEGVQRGVGSGAPRATAGCSSAARR